MLAVCMQDTAKIGRIWRSCTAECMACHAAKGMLSSMLAVCMQDSAEFGRIGRYYATESMLVWDEAAGSYAPDATPSYGRDTLEDFFARAVQDGGLEGQELGDAAVF